MSTGRPTALFEKAKQAANKNSATGKGAGGDPVAPAGVIAEAPGAELSGKEAKMMQGSMADGAQVQVPKPSTPELKDPLQITDDAIKSMSGGTAQKISPAEVERLKQEQAAKAAQSAQPVEGGDAAVVEGAEVVAPAVASEARAPASENKNEGGGGGGEDLVIGGDGAGLLTGEPQLDGEVPAEGEQVVEGGEGPANVEAAPGGPPDGDGGPPGGEGENPGAPGEGGAPGDADVTLDIGAPPGGHSGGGSMGGGVGAPLACEPMPMMSGPEMGGGGGGGLGSELSILEALATEHGGQVAAPTPMAITPSPAAIKPSDELLALSGKNATSFMEEKFKAGQGSQDLSEFTQDNTQFVQNVSQIKSHSQVTQNFGLSPFEPDAYVPFQGKGFVGGALETFQAVLGKIASVTGTVADIASIVGTVCKVAGWILSVLAPPVGAALTVVGNFLVLVEFICNIVSMSCSGLNAVIDLVRLVSTDDPRERAKFAKRFAGNLLSMAGRGLMAMAGAGTLKIGKAGKAALKGSLKGVGGAAKALATGKGLRGASTALGSGAKIMSQGFKGIQKLEDGVKAGGALARGGQSVAAGLRGGAARIKAGFTSGLRGGGRKAVSSMAGRRNMIRAVKAGAGVPKGRPLPASMMGVTNSPNTLRAAALKAAQGSKRGSKLLGRVAAPTTMQRMREFGTMARGAGKGTLQGLKSGGRQVAAGFKGLGAESIAASKPWVQSAAKAQGLVGRLKSVFGKGGTLRSGASEFYKKGVGAGALQPAVGGNRVIRALKNAGVSIANTRVGTVARGVNGILKETKLVYNAASVDSAVNKYIPTLLGEGGMSAAIDKFRDPRITDAGTDAHGPKLSTRLYVRAIFDKERSGAFKLLQKVGIGLAHGHGQQPGGLDLAPRFNQPGTSDAAQRGIDAVTPQQQQTPQSNAPAPVSTAPPTNAPAPVSTPAPQQSNAPAPVSTEAPAPQSGGGDLGAKVARMASILRQIECFEAQAGEVQKLQSRYEASLARQQYLATLAIPGADQPAAPSALGVIDQQIEKLTKAEQDAEEARLAYTDGMEHFTKKSAQADVILGEARKNRETLRTEEAAAQKEEQEQKKGQTGVKEGKKEQTKITSEGNKGKNKGEQTQGTVNSTKPGPGPEPPEEDVPWYRIDKHIVNAAKSVWRATVGKALKVIAEKWEALKRKLTQMIMQMVLGFIDPELARQVAQAGEQADQNLAANKETTGQIDQSKGKVDELEKAATTGKSEAEQNMQTFAELIVDAEEAKASATERKNQAIEWRAGIQTYVSQFEATYGISFQEASKASSEDWSAKDHSNVLQALQERIGQLATEYTQVEGEVTAELDQQNKQSGNPDVPGAPEEAPEEAPVETPAVEQNQSLPPADQSASPPAEMQPTEAPPVNEGPQSAPPEETPGQAPLSQETPQSGVDLSQTLIQLAQRLQGALGDNRQAISQELARWSQLINEGSGAFDFTAASQAVLATYDELSAPMAQEVSNILSFLQGGGDPAAARQTLQQLAQAAGELAQTVLDNARRGYLEAVADLQIDLAEAPSAPEPAPEEANPEVAPLADVAPPPGN